MNSNTTFILRDEVKWQIWRELGGIYFLYFRFRCMSSGSFLKQYFPNPSDNNDNNDNNDTKDHSHGTHQMT